MNRFLNFLTGTGVGIVAAWVNKLVGLFAGSNLSLRSWQQEADTTAVALGTGIAFVAAAICALALPRWARLAAAGAFLVGALVLAWECNALHDLLAGVTRSIDEANRLRTLWRREYIGMLLSFVAALTCATAAWWREQQEPPGSADAVGDVPGTSR